MVGGGSELGHEVILGARGHERRRDLEVAAALRENERGVTVVVLDVEVRADRDQDASELRSPFAGAAQEGRVAIAISRVE